MASNSRTVKLTRLRKILDPEVRSFLAKGAGQDKVNGRRTWVIRSANGGGPLVYGIKGIVQLLRERFPTIESYVAERVSHRLDVSTAISNFFTLDPDGPKLPPLRVSRGGPRYRGRGLLGQINTPRELDVARRIRKILLRLNPNASRPALGRAQRELLALFPKQVLTGAPGVPSGKAFERAVLAVLRKESVVV